MKSETSALDGLETAALIVKSTISVLSIIDIHILWENLKSLFLSHWSHLSLAHDW